MSCAHITIGRKWICPECHKEEIKALTKENKELKEQLKKVTDSEQGRGDGHSS